MSRTPIRVAGVVLAAGRSSRMGRPKLLLDLAGRPVLRHVLDAATAAPLEEVVVVVGGASGDVARAVGVPPRTRIVVNERYEEGQATSLRAGLEALDEGVDAAVVLLGDQPGVRTEAIAAVTEAFRGGAGPIVRAAYTGVPAHPTLLARSIWPDVMALRGDHGARWLLAHRPELSVAVEVGGRPAEDIDTDEDYRRAKAAFGSL